MEVIEKVRRMLNLAAAGSGATMHECEVAMAKALELMKKHDIEMADVTGDLKISSEDVVKSVTMERSQIDKWHSCLAIAAGTITGCRAIRSSFYKSGAMNYHYRLWMVGLPDDVAVAELIFGWLDSQMRTAWSNFDGKKSRVAMKSFYLGFANTMVRRADKETKAKKQAALEDSRSDDAKYQMIHVKKTDMVDEAMSRLFGKIRNSRGRSSNIDGDAYRAGVSAAGAASFRPRKQISR